MKKIKTYEVEGMELTIRDVADMVGCGVTTARIRLNNLTTLAEILLPVRVQGNPVLAENTFDNVVWTTAMVKEKRPDWSYSVCYDRLTTCTTLRDVFRPLGKPRVNAIIHRKPKHGNLKETGYDEEKGMCVYDDIYPCDGCGHLANCVDKDLSCKDYTFYLRWGQPEQFDDKLRTPNRGEHIRMFKKIDKNYKIAEIYQKKSKFKNPLDFLEKPSGSGSKSDPVG